MPKLTRKTVKIAGVAAIALLGVGATAALGQPIYNEVNLNQQAAQDAETLIEQATATRAQLQNARDSYDDIVIIDQQLLDQFPEQAEIQNLLNDLAATVTQAGLPEQNLTSVSFANPVISVPEAAPVAPADTEGGAATDPTAAATATGGSYATFDVGVTVSGDSTSLATVLDLLNNLDRALVIDTFSISTDQTTGVSTLSYTATAYVYSEIATPEEIAAGEPAIAEPPTTDGTAPAEETAVQP